MLGALQLGRIVWAAIADANGIPKLRPVVIVTPSDRITPTAPLDVIAVTSRVPEPLPLEACGVCGDGTDICLKDHWWRWGRADHFREPAEMGEAPSRPARVADIVAEPEGCAAQLGVLAIAEGSFTGPREGPHGFIVHLRDRGRREIA